MSNHIGIINRPLEAVSREETFLSTSTSRIRYLLLATVALCFICVAAAQQVQLSPGKTVNVQDKFGGQIFGYGLDAGGTEGMLSEIVLLNDGNLLNATETFDQKTGKILKVVHKKTETQDNLLTRGVLANHIGIEEHDHVQGIFVVKRTHGLLNPLDGNKITAKWTPPIDDKTHLLEDIEGDPGHPGVAVMASQYACCGRVVFGSDLAANTFGPIVTLKDEIFSASVPPVLAYDSKTNQAVLSQAQGSPFSVPKVAVANLTTGKVSEFDGLGFGFVNGLAVDSNTGIACTTTETDNSAEFYNLKKKTGFIVSLPVIGKYSGGAVAVDPVHKLFFISHPIPGALGQIHIYDEKGNLITSFGGFAMGPAGTNIALNPATRRAFVQSPGKNNGFSGLQSFTY